MIINSKANIEGRKLGVLADANGVGGGSTVLPNEAWVKMTKQTIRLVNHEKKVGVCGVFFIIGLVYAGALMA